MVCCHKNAIVICHLVLQARAVGMSSQNLQRECLTRPLNEQPSLSKRGVLLLGQAARFGVRENDKLVTINGKTPRNVDDAVGVIKQAGNNIKLVSHFPGIPTRFRCSCRIWCCVIKTASGPPSFFLIMPIITWMF